LSKEVTLSGVILDDYIAEIWEKRLILLLDRYRLHLDRFIQVIRNMVLSVVKQSFAFFGSVWMRVSWLFENVPTLPPVL
jgi:hypothetical protein